MVQKKSKNYWIQELELAQEHVSELETKLENNKYLNEAYQSIVDNSLLGLVIFQDGIIAFSNEAFINILGYSSEEQTQLSPAEVMSLIHPEDQAMVTK